MSPFSAAGNPLKHLPSARPSQSGFLSSSLTLALILVLLFGLYAYAQQVSRKGFRKLQLEGDGEDGEEVRHECDGIEYHESQFCWHQGARWFIGGVAILVFAINIFSIVASVVSEPLREPKFWLLKVQAIPLVTIILFAQMFATPSEQVPALINHTLVLLLLLILLVLAPVLTSIPVDADHGRLSLARKILEHIIGPTAVVAGLVAVHRVVYEQLDHEVTQPPSEDYTDDDLTEEEGYVYENSDEEGEQPRAEEGAGEAPEEVKRVQEGDTLKATETL